MSGSGAISLANSHRFQDLHGLHIESSSIGNIGCQALSNSSNLKSLKRLRLHGCEIGSDGARAIAASKRWQQLEELELCGDPIGVGLGNLGDTEHLPNLRKLVVCGRDIDNEVTWRFFGSPLMRQLNHLALQFVLLENRSVKLLAENQDLPNLTWLDLSNTLISFEDIELLLNSKRLPNLKNLIVWDNLIDDTEKKSLTELAASRGVHLFV